MRELTRTIVAAATVGVIISLLAPIGAQAAGDLVTLVDQDTDAKAQVEAGKLRVGDGRGAFTVNGQVRSLPAGGPVRLTFSDTTESVLFATGTFVVPTGQQLLITRVSGYVRLPTGQSVPNIFLRESIDPIGPGSGTFQYLEAGSSANDETGRRIVTYSEELTLPVPGGTTLSFFASRNESTGSASLEMTVSGYLIGS